MATKKTIIDLDGLLGKQRASGKPVVRDRIYLIGLELEGGWEKLPEGAALVRDGSINIPPAPGERVPPTRDDVHRALGSRHYHAEEVGGTVIIRDSRTGIIMGDWFQDFAPRIAAPQARMHIGELVSDPIERKKIVPWIGKYYPTRVNHTCGLHIHQSFRSAMDYQRLMVPEYQDTMLAYLARWAKDEGFPANHHIWGRLSGTNEYCKAEFFPDEQAMRDRKVYDHHGLGNRYTAINYCYGQHKTIECRVLPMMETGDQAIRAINTVLDVTNACLVALAAREEKLNASYSAQGDDVYRDVRQDNIY